MQNPATDDMAFLVSAFSASFKPIPTLSIAEYAEANLSIPSGNAEPGPVSLDRTPYVRQILDDMSPSSPVKDICVCTGTQIGKTTMELYCMAFYADARPTTQIFAFSTDDLVKVFSKTKYEPMMRANPKLSVLIGKTGQGNRNGSTIRLKTYPGGFIFFGSLKNADELRSHSVQIIYGDELDSADSDVRGEGDPTKLLNRRTQTYGDTGKHMYTSTPVNTDGLIWPMLNSGTYYEYNVKCPHCGQYLSLEWEHMRWNVDPKNPIHATEVWMECPHCGGHLHDSDKYWMYAREQEPHWVARNPHAIVHSYHLSSLYSPVGWMSWDEIVDEYLEAVEKKDVTKLTTWHNTLMAEPYDYSVDSPDWKGLMDRAKENPRMHGVIPRQVDVLISASDLQKDRIETVLIGVDRKLRYYIIDRYQFFAKDGSDTESPDCNVWQEYADSIINATFMREDDVPMRTVANGLDRSYHSAQVDAFYQRIGDPNRFHPTHGEYKYENIVPRMRESGLTKGKGLVKARFYDIDTIDVKLMVAGYLRIEDPDSPHHIDIPNGLDTEFFAQLCSEVYIPPGKGYRRGHWKKNRERNEVWDCLHYAIDLTYLPSISLISMRGEDWDALEEELSGRRVEHEALAQKKKAVARRRVRTRGIV